MSGKASTSQNQHQTTAAAHPAPATHAAEAAAAPADASAKADVTMGEVNTWLTRLTDLQTSASTLLSADDLARLTSCIDEMKAVKPVPSHERAHTAPAH